MAKYSIREGWECAVRAKTQTQSHFTILLRKLPEPCPHVPKKHRAQSLSPRTVCHLNSPQLLPALVSAACHSFWAVSLLTP